MILCHVSIILWCFDNVVLSFNNFVLCFDNFVLSFNNFVLCFHFFVLCFTNIDLCFKNTVLCFKNSLSCLQILATVTTHTFHMQNRNAHIWHILFFSSSFSPLGTTYCLRGFLKGWNFVLVYFYY